MNHIDRIIEEHASEIQHISQQLAMNFEVPVQRTINAGFARMGISRFDRSGDVWEQIVCRQNGWEYEVPPQHLMNRWATY